MDTYEILIKNIRSYFKSKGFKYLDNSFVLNEFGNWGFIEFQKSMSNTKTVKKFTINLKITSKVIREFEGDENVELPDKKFSVLDQRIGFLLSIKQDFWWTIDENTNFTTTQSKLISILDSVAIPYIKCHISDESLISNWLSEKLQNNQGVDYENLIILLKKYNRPELNDKIAKYKSWAENKKEMHAYNFLIKRLKMN